MTSSLQIDCASFSSIVVHFSCTSVQPSSSSLLSFSPFSLYLFLSLSALRCFCLFTEIILNSGCSPRPLFLNSSVIFFFVSALNNSLWALTTAVPSLPSSYSCSARSAAKCSFRSPRVMQRNFQSHRFLVGARHQTFWQGDRTSELSQRSSAYWDFHFYSNYRGDFEEARHSLHDSFGFRALGQEVLRSMLGSLSPPVSRSKSECRLDFEDLNWESLKTINTAHGL